MAVVGNRFWYRYNQYRGIRKKKKLTVFVNKKLTYLTFLGNVTGIIVSGLFGLDDRLVIME
jgi:hypothetical protein